MNQTLSLKKGAFVEVEYEFGRELKPIREIKYLSIHSQMLCTNWNVKCFVSYYHFDRNKAWEKYILLRNITENYSDYSFLFLQFI